MEIVLANPRGFCAGVDRAIAIVERALELFGPPIHVRHEVVHNHFVVQGLEQKGAVFVDELHEVPDGSIVIFSAHGVSLAVREEAKSRGLEVYDATCPLVTKVHMEVSRFQKDGRECVLIGHEGHPEVEGTLGQYRAGQQGGAMYLVESPDDVARLNVHDPSTLAYVTQTTLSVDDTAEVVAALKSRFPAIKGPHKEDICYATTNRQAAVKAIAPKADAILVVGAPNSSNSRRLVEVGAKAGCSYSQLVQRAENIDWRALEGIGSVGVTAGASAPEVLVEEVIDAFRARYDVTVEQVETAVENVEFKVPRVLRSPA